MPARFEVFIIRRGASYQNSSLDFLSNLLGVVDLYACASLMRTWAAGPALHVQLNDMSEKKSGEEEE